MRSEGFRKLRVVVAASVAGAGIVPGVARRAAASSILPVPHDVQKSSARWRIDTGDAVGGAFGTNNGLGLLNGTVKSVTTTTTTSTTVTFTTSTTTTTTTTTQCVGHTPPSDPTTCFTVPHVNPHVHNNPHAHTHTHTHTNTNTPVSAALDGAFQLKVGRSVFEAPNGQVHIVDADTVDVTRKLSRVNVTVRYDFLPGDIVRVLFSFTNRRSIPKTLTLRVGSALNTDPTQINGTDDGDLAIETKDAWFLVSEGAPSSVPGLVIARGDNSTAKTSLETKILQAPTASSDRFIEKLTLKVGGKKTRRLLFYTRLFRLGGATADHRFDNASSLATNGLLVGLTPTERAQIKNWKGLAGV